MSVQMALLAPATRVASRKLGPTAGRRSDSSPSRPAACVTSRLASTCGRCETQAIRRSWVSASMALGRAPKLTSSRCRRSYSTPAVLPCAGVRYQLAPSKRSSRACSTPAVSAPASGCPPTNRSSEPASASSRLVEPTSLTTQSGPAAASARRTVSASAPTGAATNTTSASATAEPMSSAAMSMAPSSRALASTRSSGSYPHTCASARVRAARPIEPPISPTPRTATLKWPAPAPGASDAAQRLARQRGGLLHGAGVVGEVLGPQRLGSVADGLVGVGVHLDDDPVGADGGSGERQRQHQVAPPGGVARIDDHWQVRELLEHGHGHQVEREAVGGLECADAALAQHHVGVAFLENVPQGRHPQRDAVRARHPHIRDRLPLHAR